MLLPKTVTWLMFFEFPFKTLHCVCCYFFFFWWGVVSQKQTWLVSCWCPSKHTHTHRPILGGRGTKQKGAMWVVKIGRPTKCWRSFLCPFQPTEKWHPEESHTYCGWTKSVSHHLRNLIISTMPGSPVAVFFFVPCTLPRKPATVTDRSSNSAIWVVSFRANIRTTETLWFLIRFPNVHANKRYGCTHGFKAVRPDVQPSTVFQKHPTPGRKAPKGAFSPGGAQRQRPRRLYLGRRQGSVRPEGKVLFGA